MAILMMRENKVQSPYRSNSTLRRGQERSTGEKRLIHFSIIKNPILFLEGFLASVIQAESCDLLAHKLFNRVYHILLIAQI